MILRASLVAGVGLALPVWARNPTYCWRTAAPEEQGFDVVPGWT